MTDLEEAELINLLIDSIGNLSLAVRNLNKTLNEMRLRETTKDKLSENCS